MKTDQLEHYIERIHHAMQKGQSGLALSILNQALNEQREEIKKKILSLKIMSDWPWDEKTIDKTIEILDSLSTPEKDSHE